MLQESCFIEVSPPLNSLLLTTAGYLVYALSDVLFYITPIPSSKWVTPTFLWPYTIGSQILLPPMFGVIFANMLLNLIHRQNLDTLLCYPAVKTGSFVMTQYRRVTDGRTDRNSIANTARSTAARCKMYQQSMICISSYQDRSYVLLHRVHQAIHWLQVWLYYYLSTHRPSYVIHSIIMSIKVQSYIDSVCHLVLTVIWFIIRLPQLFIASTLNSFVLATSFPINHQRCLGAPAFQGG